MSSCGAKGTWAPDNALRSFFTSIRHRTFSPVAENSYLRCPLFFRSMRFAAIGVLPGSRGFSESMHSPLDIHCGSM
jgi:hypothetical protein